jgi:hypothetical protein
VDAFFAAGFCAAGLLAFAPACFSGFAAALARADAFFTGAAGFLATGFSAGFFVFTTAGVADRFEAVFDFFAGVGRAFAFFVFCPARATTS